VSDKELSNKQQAFIDEYIIDMNATQAAIRAGLHKRNTSTNSAHGLQTTRGDSVEHQPLGAQCINIILQYCACNLAAMFNLVGE